MKRLKRGLQPGLATLRALVVIGGVVLAACVPAKAPAPQNVSQAGQSANIVLSAPRLKLGQVLYSGVVKSIQPGELVVGDLVFRTDSLTAIPAGLESGTPVKIVAVQLPDDTRYAIEVAVLRGTEGSQPAGSQATTSHPESSGEFEFYGVVQKINGSDWVISGVQVVVNAPLQANPAIVVGSTVHVDGVVINGKLIANEIQTDLNHEDEDKNTESEKINAGSDQHDEQEEKTATIQPLKTMVSDETETPEPKDESGGGGDDHKDDHEDDGPSKDEDGGHSDGGRGGD